MRARVRQERRALCRRCRVRRVCGGPHAVHAVHTQQHDGQLQLAAAAASGVTTPPVARSSASALCARARARACARARASGVTVPAGAPSRPSATLAALVARARPDVQVAERVRRGAVRGRLPSAPLRHVVEPHAQAGAAARVREEAAPPAVRRGIVEHEPARAGGGVSGPRTWSSSGRLHARAGTGGRAARGPHATGHRHCARHRRAVSGEPPDVVVAAVTQTHRP